MTDSAESTPEHTESPTSAASDGDKVLIVTPEGMAVTSAEGSPAAQISEPGKVMRIATMVKQLLDEVKAAPLDEAARARLADIHDKSIVELKEVLAPELAQELSEIALPFDDTTTPSEAELRIAQAQLVGWLEGLFHGIQSVLFAQQMMAKAQFEQVRRALPPSAGDPSAAPEMDASTGPYL